MEITISFNTTFSAFKKIKENKGIIALVRRDNLSRLAPPCLICSDYDSTKLWEKMSKFRSIKELEEKMIVPLSGPLLAEKLKLKEEILNISLVEQKIPAGSYLAFKSDKELTDWKISFDKVTQEHRKEMKDIYYGGTYRPEKMKGYIPDPVDQPGVTYQELYGDRPCYDFDNPSWDINAVRPEIPKKEKKKKRMFSFGYASNASSSSNASTCGSSS